MRNGVLIKGDARIVIAILSKQGVTLVELLVSLGIATVLILSCVTLALQVTQSNRKANISPMRDQLTAQVRQAAGDLTGLNVTLHSAGGGLSGNTAFYQCVCGGVGTSCTSLDRSASHYGAPFTLYNRDGTVQSPSFYDASGSPCGNSNSPQCMIRIRTFFLAQCAYPGYPGPAANADPLPSCPAPAEFFLISYIIDQNPESIATQSVILKPITGSRYTQTADLMREFGGLCP